MTFHPWKEWQDESAVKRVRSWQAYSHACHMHLNSGLVAGKVFRDELNPELSKSFSTPEKFAELLPSANCCQHAWCSISSACAWTETFSLHLLGGLLGHHTSSILLRNLQETCWKHSLWSSRARLLALNFQWLTALAEVCQACDPNFESHYQICYIWQQLDYRALWSVCRRLVASSGSKWLKPRSFSNMLRTS